MLPVSSVLEHMFRSEPFWEAFIVGQAVTDRDMLADLEESYRERRPASDDGMPGKLVLNSKERIQVGKEIRLLRSAVEKSEFSLTGDKEAEQIIAEMDKIAGVGA